MKKWILENLLDLPKYREDLKEELKPEVKKEIYAEVISDVTTQAMEHAREEVRQENEKNGNSKLTFEFTPELGVKTHSKINADILTKLVEEQYINADQTEDKFAIQLAFILLTNEATEQMITEINSKASEVFGED